ncbi:MAG TPA: amino acid racemase [Steroidobacteraceae bacterium]|jgi:aspartate racemase|nr:amino acid racemase [Steroidobacteraceae bacterium]
MRRIVGVLGGMGPTATVDFLTKVIALTPAECDQEHVPLLVHQVPQIPDRSTAIMQGSDAPFAPMLQGLRRLATAGAEFAAIPCSSAHHWYDQLADSQPLKILHIVDAVWLELVRREMGSCRVALLATRGTIKSDMYVDRLRSRSMTIVPIDEPTQRLVDHAIAQIKGGNRLVAARSAGEAANRAFAQGAEALILACTELPIALEERAGAPTYIDATLALARHCVSESIQGVPPPIKP